MRLQIAGAMAQFRKPEAHSLHEMPVTLGEMILEFLARANHNFCGGGGRGSADVRDKIRNGEIALVAYTRNHRNFRCDYGARYTRRKNRWYTLKMDLNLPPMAHTRPWLRCSVRL